jgi:hypothetical protein
LREQAVSLAFSTYRANRLLFLGVDEQANPSLKLHERLFDRPMGLFVAGESIWMAARCQLWRLDNLLGPGQLHEGGDRLYVPAVSYTTGVVNAHELVLGPDGQPIFVNTAFSCLALLHHGTPVGWLLAHRTGPNSVRYSSLFVAPDHRSRARALALLAEGFRRQHAATIPTARAAIDRRNTAMLRLLKRHLGVHLSSIGRSRLTQAPPLQAPPLEPPPPQTSSPPDP